jgi:hypothetical protein
MRCTCIEFFHSPWRRNVLPALQFPERRPADVWFIGNAVRTYDTDRRPLSSGIFASYSANLSLAKWWVIWHSWYVPFGKACRLIYYRGRLYIPKFINEQRCWFIRDIPIVTNMALAL